MHHLRRVLVLGLPALVAACGSDPQRPDIEPVDTAQTRGTLLTSSESLAWWWIKLVWVPGTELVAFTSSSPTGDCAIKTVDATTGSTGVVDGDCTSLYRLLEPYLRRLVAAPDGNALYYTVVIAEAGEREYVLRVADPVGGGTSTLRSVRWEAALAVSPDGQHLAYVTSDSLIVRDLSSGTETHYADFDQETTAHAGPILFSPDGSELLYVVRDRISLSRILHRLSLDDGADELVSLPELAHARLFHWGVSGLEVLLEQWNLREFHVLNFTTGESVQVGSAQREEGGPIEQLGWWNHAWSIDGTRVAYWIHRCFGVTAMFECVVGRSALFVADTRWGTWVRVAYTAGSGPIVFSPDGTRLVYHDSDGDFYVVEVP
jgi:Tol biopolymer transport system component